MSHKNKNIIISGGGTGGHIFPAISIANALKAADPEINILFVGAEGRMEMEKVPAAGYDIVGLPVMGMPRKLSFKIVKFAFSLLRSLRKAAKVVKEYKPIVAVGVGGYASGPVLKAASKKGIATVLQEQNSYAGVTNKLLAQKASSICVAYEGMEKYFPADKIVLTGNPVRESVISFEGNREEAFAHFYLNKDQKVILVLGGSLGAKSINEALLKNIDAIANSGVQWIWQCGKLYFEHLQKEIGDKYPNIRLMDFIQRMDYVFEISDLVISRSGAGTISELCLAGKPTIFVPSPNVAEDHQTKNAQALVAKDAALMIKDTEIDERLCVESLGLVKDAEKLKELSANILNMAFHNSDKKIVDEILKLL